MTTVPVTSGGHLLLGADICVFEWLENLLSVRILRYPSHAGLTVQATWMHGPGYLHLESLSLNASSVGVSCTL